MKKDLTYNWILMNEQIWDYWEYDTWSLSVIKDLQLDNFIVQYIITIDNFIVKKKNRIFRKI